MKYGCGVIMTRKAVSWLEYKIKSQSGLEPLVLPTYDTCMMYEKDHS